MATSSLLSTCLFPRNGLILLGPYGSNGSGHKAIQEGSQAVRILAAMSGGVDSAVAAARAVKAGHEVVGVHLALSRDPQAVRESSRGCCSLEDSADARRVCDKLGIPFYVWDFSDRFKEDVIDDFIDSYARLTQPIDGGDGYLRRAIDPDKDQSYVLGVLGAEEIKRCMFPVGDTKKPQIREEAGEMGFSVAKKPDSYDICFIPDGNTQAFLGKHIGVRPGLIVDQEGTPLREHQGVHEFTIGQRKGLDLRNPAADGRPRYVTDINAQTGVVTVGPRENPAITTIHADRLKFLHPAMEGELECEVQVRAHGSVVPCHARIDKDNDRMELSLHTPLQGVARGQAAVLYLPDPDGDIVLGSGTICGTAHS